MTSNGFEFDGQLLGAAVCGHRLLLDIRRRMSDGSRSVQQRHTMDGWHSLESVAPFIGQQCVFTEDTFYRILNIRRGGQEPGLYHVIGVVGTVPIDMYVRAESVEEAARLTSEMLDPDGVKESSLDIIRQVIPESR